MGRWSRRVAGLRADHLVAALGCLYVVAGLGRVFPVVGAGEPPENAVLEFVQIAGPGVVLLYGGFRLPRTGIDRDVYPRILLWCLGTAAVLVGLVGMLVLDPDLTINQPFWATVLATAVGNVGGLAIGANEARAITRAREARKHERQLERQNDRLESFASMLAHELRNPLNVAQIYFPQAADGDQAAAAEVENALDRIEEMIEILLVTARRSDSEVDWEPVALPAVAADAWEDLSLDGGTLVVETDRTIRADPVHLRHMLENLFQNSVEHGSTNNRPGVDDAVEHSSTSPRSGAPDDAVESDTDDVTVRLGDRPGGFFVADDGPGIPDERREAVFEAGFTTDASGFGLGLTFVARLAETYDWECTVTESVEGGARFEFRNVEILESGDRTD